MLLTAHGGALGTGRNTLKYFDIIKNYNADVIEVDIYRRGSLLYISHLPKAFPKKALPLSYVFEFIKKYNFKVNCDVKRGGLAKSVMELARQIGVQDRIIFTGSIKRKDLHNLGEAEVYLNTGFFFPHKPKKINLYIIKKKIKGFNNSSIKGINLRYTYCNEEMLEEEKKIGLKLSIFTVDKIDELKRLMQHKEIDNITTNIINKALQLREILTQ